MNKDVYDPRTDSEDGPLDPAEALDNDKFEDELEGGYAPDRYSAGEGYGTTASEEVRGESLDQLLAEEEPDVDPHAEAVGATLASDTKDGSGLRPGTSWPKDEGGSVPPLVADDEGAHEDTTAELVAHEAGRPNDRESAEEQAMHLEHEE